MGEQCVFILVCLSLQEVREMINLPNTGADMLPADFEGIAEALKGKCIQIKEFIYMENNPHVNPNPSSVRPRGD